MSILTNYSLELATFQYVLVDFPEDKNALALVCTSWIFYCEDSSVYKCKWPGSINANKFAKKRVKPSSNWDIFSCNIKRFFRTYEAGNDNLKSYTSDESFVDPNKRKLFPNKRFCSSSDDQLLVGLEKKTKHLEVFTLPPMPLYQSTQKVEVPIESTPPHSEIVINDFNISPPMFNYHNSNDSLTTFVEDINYQNKSSEQSVIATLKDSPEVPLINSQVNSQPTFGIDQVTNLLNDVSDQYKLIQNTLNEIKVDIVDIQNQIQHQGLLLRLNHGNVDDDSLKLPFETVLELDEFELNLKVDDLHESRMKNCLLKVGHVKQPSKTVYNLLKKVMTNKVAETFNITGKGNKKAFGKYKISQIIQNVVYSLQGTTEVDYLNFLGLWLRQSNNRGAN